MSTTMRPSSPKACQTDCDKLNRLVLRKTEKYFETHKGKPTVKATSHAHGTIDGVPIEFAAVRAGNNVIYRERYAPVTMFLMAVGVYLLTKAPSMASFVIGFATTFLWYDLYSGILHVVLDHPENINLPLIGQACLEFQWHHHIPQDITSKSFFTVCGDLNLVAGLSVAWYVGVMGYTAGIPALIAGSKLLMAFFGQYCHRMSHAVPKARPQWVKLLQASGLMLSPEAHGVHHSTYDDNFCIGAGLFNPVVSFLLHRVTDNKYVWLFTLLTLSFTDVFVITNVLQALLPEYIQ